MKTGVSKKPRKTKLIKLIRNLAREKNEKNWPIKAKVSKCGMHISNKGRPYFTCGLKDESGKIDAIAYGKVDAPFFHQSFKKNKHPIPAFPGPDASVDDLIKYYHHNMYTQAEIRAFLILRHGTNISKSRVRRIIGKLGLHRNNIESPHILILEGIHKLHESGFVDAGYRVMWRLLNVNLGVRATQRTVMRLVKSLDPEGVILRSGHRLRRRMYKNGGPNCVVHIDGYDKLKPYGFPIHGAIVCFSRKVLWLKVIRSNKNPYSISKLYLDMDVSKGRVPKLIRSDAGTENDIVNELQSVLRSDHADVRQGEQCYMVGRSTGNQRIEAFWSFLKRIFTSKWRNTFRDLEQLGLFNPADTDDIENGRMWFSSVLHTAVRS